MAPLKILELRTVFGTGGGPEKTILLGTARTDRSRYSITVCYIRDERDRVFQIDKRAQSLPVDYIEVTERSSLDAHVWPKLKAIVADRDIDIVHAHDYKTDLLALLLAKQSKVIPLSTAHGWTGHTVRERWLYYPADRFLLARFPHVVAVSSNIKDMVVAAGARPDNVTVVLNGIDPALFRRDPGRVAEARARYGALDGEIVLGAVGRLESQKRFDVLIASFARLSSEMPNLRLLIAGDGSLKGPLLEQIGLAGISSRCHLLGHVNDVRLFHHALDVFVQSSDYEGTPNAVLEAMALETPVVATDAGGTAEIARHGQEGLIVRPDREDEMRLALREALDNVEATARRTAAARRRVEGDLSFDTRMRKIERIYDELATRFPRRRAGDGQSLSDACATR